MKVRLTNFEIERYINIIANPMSFRNNVSIKVSAEMDWVLRVNLKMLEDRYSLFISARDDINKEFIDANKIDGEMVKKEFIPEYNERMNTLYSQINEFEFSSISVDDMKGLDMLSMPERDFLNLMLEENTKTEEQ